MKVRVHWNLHKKCWSVHNSNRLLFHITHLILKDCKMIVRPAGRERVLRENRKNVHAFIEGKISDFPNEHSLLKSLTYNPYKYPYFYDKDTFEKIESVSICELLENGSVRY